MCAQALFSLFTLAEPAVCWERACVLGPLGAAVFATYTAPLYPVAWSGGPSPTLPVPQAPAGSALVQLWHPRPSPATSARLRVWKLDWPNLHPHLVTQRALGHLNESKTTECMMQDSVGHSEPLQTIFSPEILSSRAAWFSASVAASRTFAARASRVVCSACSI